MQELFPNEQQIAIFSKRYAAHGFDPVAIMPIISPATQMRPKSLHQLETGVTMTTYSPLLPAAPSPNSGSPKRSYDDSESEHHPPRKIARSESPLKGAAGRRMDAKRTALRNEIQQNGTAIPQMQAPPLLPSAIMYLLSIIPPAHKYNATVLSADKIVNLLRTIDPASKTRQMQAPNPQVQYGFPPQAREFMNDHSHYI